MFDDLRQQAENESSFDEEPQESGNAKPALKALAGFTRESRGRRGPSSDIVFGLTGFQRFVLSVLFLLMVVMLGIVILIVTGRVILPL